MRLSAAAVAMLLGLALALSACGEDGTTAADTASSTRSTSGEASPSPAPTSAAARRACRRQLAPFVVSLAKLRAELARGLSYDDYLVRVRRVRRTYAGIHANRVPAGCVVTSGGPAERAFNLYIDAANSWGDCLTTVTCSTRSIEPELQRKWARASHHLATARQGLGASPNS